MTLRYLAIREVEEDRSAAARKAWDTRGRGKKKDSPLGQSPPKNPDKPKHASKPDDWQVGHTDYSFLQTDVLNNVITNGKDEFHVFENNGGFGYVRIDAALPNHVAIHYLNQVSNFQNNGFSIDVTLHNRRANATNYGGEPDLAGVWEGGQQRIQIFNATNNHMMNETIHHELMHAVFDSWREAVSEKNVDWDGKGEDPFTEFTDFIKRVDHVLEPNDLTSYLASYFKGGINYKARSKSRYTETMAAMAQIERSPDPQRQFQWQRFSQKYPNITKIYYNVRKNIG
jgi:hypothetical protein